MPAWPGTRSSGARRSNPFWTHVIDVGNVATTTVDLSKDNVVFGIRSVGTNGYRSPAVFPFRA